MEVRLTGDQKAFVRQAIQTGRFTREENALREALSLWKGRERRRAEILAAVDQAEASSVRAQGRKVNNPFPRRAQTESRIKWLRSICRVWYVIGVRYSRKSLRFRRGDYFKLANLIPNECARPH